MKLSRHNYSTLQVQNKIKLPQSYNQGSPFLLHFGFTVTATLVSCHRHCKLQVVRMEENTATWWKKGIGNICSCSKYKHFRRGMFHLSPSQGNFLTAWLVQLHQCPHSHTPAQHRLPPHLHLAQGQLTLQLWLNIQRKPKDQRRQFPFSSVFEHIY